VQAQTEFKGREQRPPADTPGPGPGAFNLKLPRKPGCKISKYLTGRHALERPADKTPGPCSYEVDKDTSQLAYKGATLGARTNLPSQVALLEETRKPGPGHYDLPPGRIRGGGFGTERQRAEADPTRYPGPSAYYATPTVAQERELRRLSKQVMGLVSNREQTIARYAERPPPGSASAGGSIGGSTTGQPSKARQASSSWTASTSTSNGAFITEPGEMRAEMRAPREAPRDRQTDRAARAVSLPRL